MSLVLLPYMYVPDPTRGRPVFNGKIYIGNPDTNPRLPENQKSALLVQEDGSVVEAAYPIATNSGGVPTYDGSPVAIDAVGEYSLAIDDRNDNQVYYFPNAGSILEFITTDLRSIMFDLCLEYDDIGTVIVTDVEGTDLDDAEWILDIETGAVWRVPPDVPAGSTVVSLVDNILTTNNGQFTVTVTKCPIAQNKIKTSQFVVEGTTGDPLPSTTPTGYLVGAEMAFGWVVTTDVVDAVIDANGNLTATSGVVEYTFDKADNETPNAASLFASVMRCTDAANSVYVQDYANGSNGISLINETATTITLEIDFSSFAGGKVFGVSEQLGRLEIKSTERIIEDLVPELQRSMTRKTSLTRVEGDTYTNNSKLPLTLIIGYNGTAGSNTTYNATIGGNVYPVSVDNQPNVHTTQFTVLPGEDYVVTSGALATLSFWHEISAADNVG